jgi:2-polyprenyl-6-methoxyphenol hydroxylase-like FAD-dependent oxidoreductase
MIVVVGAGIAGLSFAIQLVQRDPCFWAKKVVILEAGKDDNSRKGRYGHSLSVRQDVGGVAALERLGLAESIRAKATGSSGFFIARSNAALVLSTTWFGSTQEYGIRVMRYVLWRTLYDRARELGIEIRFDCQVFDAKDQKQEGKIEVALKSTISGESLPSIGAQLLVVADGSRSQVRDVICPGSARNFLKVSFVGIKMPEMADKIPESVRNQHGLLVGNGFTMFIADEGGNDETLALSFLTDKEVPEPFSSSPEVSKKVQSGLAQFHPLVSGTFKEAMEKRDPRIYTVNCYDRLPQSPLFGRIVFIGDASHAVSPFSGSGANMALVDGVTLADNIHDAIFKAGTPRADHLDEKAIALAVEAFFTSTESRWMKVIQQQRSMINSVHSTGWFARFTRSILFRALPIALQTNWKKVGMYSMIGVAGIAVARTYWRSKN